MDTFYKGVVLYWGPNCNSEIYSDCHVKSSTAVLWCGRALSCCTFASFEVCAMEFCLSDVAFPIGLENLG